MALVVKLAQPDGKVFVTEGLGKGKVLWKDLIVTPTVVTANQKGVVSLPKDPRVSDGKVAHVNITVPSHPDLHADLDIPITYDYNFVANFPGSAGSSGLNGSDGMAGAPGKQKSESVTLGSIARRRNLPRAIDNSGGNGLGVGSDTAVEQFR